MATNRFYDIHFHEMDLSHAALTAFAVRALDELNFNLKLLDKFGRAYTVWYVIKLIGSSIIKFIINPAEAINDIISIFDGSNKKSIMTVNKILNLLNFMDSPIENDFLVVEYFLKNPKLFTNAVVSQENKFSMDGVEYNKIVICPLIMDFGSNIMDTESFFYDLIPPKPVVRQTEDLLNAIKTYYKSDLQVTGKNYTTVDTATTSKDQKLFEIYPFMGINTQNYTYEKIQTMLDKYFSDFDPNETAEARRNKLHDKMGEFSGSLDDTVNCSNIFAGIKVYPPLGFDPWPEACPACPTATPQNHCECERSKVKLLYQYCIDHRIPMTSHTGNGGFKIAKDYFQLTDPGNKWKEVLANYPELKLNFAHFGRDGEGWREQIIEYINKPYSNVYTDFSCNLQFDDYYLDLNNVLDSQPEGSHLEDKIMYGSDFMIHLMWINSLNEYMKCWINSNKLCKDKKIKMSQTNSYKFLFG